MKKKIGQAKQDLPEGEVSYVPEDSLALRGLAQVNQDVVHEWARRCAGERIATIDMAATVMESGKREAKATYQGGSGSHYEPPRFPSPG
jgi:oxalate decarboxylase/phosphoglucose isomerase-like protein (cupin superfamily)